MGLLDLLNQITNITNNDNKFIYDTKIIKDEKSKEQKALERQRIAALNSAEKQKVKSTLNMELPIDFENIFANDEDANSITCDSSSDGLMLSLANKGIEEEWKNIMYVNDPSSFGGPTISAQIKLVPPKEPEQRDSIDAEELKKQVLEALAELKKKKQ